MDVQTLGKRLDEINSQVRSWCENEDRETWEKAFDLHTALDRDLEKEGSSLAVVWQAERMCYVLV